MVVYGESLFIENLIAGVVILFLTGRICGFEIKALRIIVAGVICALFSFVIFIKMNVFVSLIVKILMSIVAVVSAFGLSTGSELKLLKSIPVFYIVSFVMGGITISVINFRGIEGVTANGYMYTKSPTYMTITTGILLTYLITDSFIKSVRGRINSDRLLRTIRIRVGNNEFELLGYTDTGNHLRDPLLGRPVSVISRSAADALFIMLPEGELETRYCAVPYRSAGVERGIMDGFRVDAMQVDGGERKLNYRSSIFAIYDGDFKERDGVKGFDVLLSREIIEGGII